jgi:hypothetical protein
MAFGDVQTHLYLLPVYKDGNCLLASGDPLLDIRDVDGISLIDALIAAAFPSPALL